MLRREGVILAVVYMAGPAMEATNSRSPGRELSCESKRPGLNYARWNTGMVSKGAGTSTQQPPEMVSWVSRLVQDAPWGRYTRRVRWPASRMGGHQVVRAEAVLVLDLPCGGIGGEFVEQGPHDRLTLLVGCRHDGAETQSNAAV